MENFFTQFLPYQILGVIVYGFLINYFIKWLKNRKSEKNYVRISVEKRIVVFITNAIGFSFPFAVIGIILSSIINPKDIGLGFLAMQYGVLVSIVFALIKAIFYELFKSNKKILVISIFACIITLFMLLKFSGQ